MRALVIGGSRFIGLAIVRRMSELGWRVTVFNRGSRPDSIYPRGVEALHGDRNERWDWASLGRREFDAVLDISAYRPEQTALALEAMADRSGRVLHCGTGAVYSPSDVFPLKESHPMGEWPVWGQYGRDKRRCDELLFEANVERGLPTVIVRPPYVLGPANYAARETFVWDLLRKGSSVPIPDDGEALQQFVFVDEVAEVFARLAAAPLERVGGQAFHCAGDEYWTLRGFVRECARFLGRTPQFEEVRDYVREPFDLNAFFPFPNVNYLLDNTKVKEVTGIAFRPLRVGLDEVFRWYREARGQ